MTIRYLCDWSAIPINFQQPSDQSQKNTKIMGELKYELSQNAYIKLVLQARKHKTAAVNGVLLGRVSPQNDAVVEIADSVPLFHSHLGLLPNLEISLIMVIYAYTPSLFIRVYIIKMNDGCWYFVKFCDLCRSWN